MELYAKDIMSTELVTATPRMSCDELVELLTSQNISGVPVLGTNKELLGVITMSDMIRNGRFNALYKRSSYYEDPCWIAP